MKTGLLVLLSLSFASLFSESSTAQTVLDDSRFLEIAEKKFSNGQFKDALIFYRKTLMVNSAHPIAMYRLEVCKARLGSRVNCKKLKKAVLLGYEATKSELFFYGCE